jgi:REP element-mobilizing transposase RayT
LFGTNADRRFVVRTAAGIFEEECVRCLAWALLSNHYHMLLRFDSTPPGRVLQRLNTTIAVRARRLRGERGPVFQSRYFSRICTDDGAYDQMFAYTLGNPLRHGVLHSLAELERHPWSGLGELLGLTPAKLIDIPVVLSHFHDDPAVARRSVRELMLAKLERWQIEPPHEPDELNLPRRVVDDESLRRGLAAIVGTPDPVVGDWESRAGRRTLLLRSGWTVDRLIEDVCQRTGAQASAVREGNRGSAAIVARSLVLFVACDVVGLPCGESARAVGVGVSAATAARRRGRALFVELGWTPSELLGTVLTSSPLVKSVPGPEANVCPQVHGK